MSVAFVVHFSAEDTPILVVWSYGWLSPYLFEICVPLQVEHRLTKGNFIYSGLLLWISGERSGQRRPYHPLTDTKQVLMQTVLRLPKILSVGSKLSI